VDNKAFSKHIEKRTLEFTIKVIQFVNELPFSPEAKVIRTQITRSASSVGANYREANRSRNRADFRNKIRICEAEASETLYWIEIIDRLNWSAKKRLLPLRQECQELLALFCSIGKNI
jgi:four helix bundle protein